MFIYPTMEAYLPSILPLTIWIGMGESFNLEKFTLPPCLIGRHLQMLVISSNKPETQMEIFFPDSSTQPNSTGAAIPRIEKAMLYLPAIQKWSYNPRRHNALRIHLLRLKCSKS